MPILLRFALPFVLLLLSHGYVLSQLKPFSFKFRDSALYAFTVKNIKVLDNRADTRNLGYIKTSLGGPYVPVMPNDSLENDLADFLMTQFNKQDTGINLVLHIRKFSFAELNQKGLQYGFFRFRAELFREVANAYNLMGKIDTLVEVIGNDATPKMFKAANRTLSQWLEYCFQRPQQDSSSWTLSSIQKIDKLEKSKIPLYNLTALPNGMYAGYASIAALTPDNPDLKVIYREENDQLLIEKKDKNK